MSTAPDYIEPLEAWRVWHVVTQGGVALLRSVIKPTVWMPGEPLTAECLRRRRFLRRRGTLHAAPEPECDCGIYATSRDRVGEYLQEPLPPGAVARIMGRVQLWGTVVECERGYRAQFAYPLELYVEQPELAEQLAAAYAVPLGAAA
jgi:hypothetical protein